MSVTGTVRGARWGGGLGVAVLAAIVACGHESARRPNVILISIDSMRADHLDCYGYKSTTSAPTSPKLDELARDGVLFEHAVSTTSWTMPSHVALMCGQPDLLHGAISDENGPTPARVVLAEAMRRAGYSTAGVYSAPYLEPRYGFGAGFDVYENRGAKDEIASHQGSYARQVSDRAIELLEERGRREAADPLFLFVHYFDVHYDYVPPEESYAKRFWPNGERPRIDGERFIEREDVNPGMDPAALAGVVSFYDGEIAWVDEQVGRLLARVKRLGLEDDTLVVVVSDHGDEFFEHGCKGHRKNLFEPTLDVALMLRWPGHLPADRRVPQRVSLVDVAPTILELARADDAADALAATVSMPNDPALLHGMWGRSLAPLIAGRDGADRETLGFLANRWQDREHPVDTWALWTGAMKVIVSQRYEWDAERLLRPIAIEGHVFDLARDRAELHDLAADPTPAVAQAIGRFEELLCADGALQRLASALPAGSPPRFASDAEREAHREELRAQGYVVDADPTPLPPGTKLAKTLPPPPRFPRAR